MEKNKKILLGIVLVLLCIVGGLSFAYFMNRTNINGPGSGVTGNINEVGSTLKVEGTIAFDDPDIYPGHQVASTIKVIATGDNELIPYNLIWNGINTLQTPLKVTVYKSSELFNVKATCEKKTKTEDNKKYLSEECNLSNLDKLGEAVATTTINTSSEEEKLVLIERELITATAQGSAMYYYIILEYPNLDTPQNYDKNGTFEGSITAEKGVLDDEKPIIEDVSVSNTTNSITVNVKASDNLGIAKYYYSINNGTSIEKDTNTHTFTGLTTGQYYTITVYVRDIVGNESDKVTKTVSLATGETTLAKLNLVAKDGTPNFKYRAGSYSTGNVSANRYFTYADSYTLSNGKYTLINPKVCQYSSCYENLNGKYVVSYSGSTSTTAATSTNLSVIYLVGTTLSNKIYYMASNLDPNYRYDFNQGLFATPDDTGNMSYYFRGDISNNYLKFGKHSASEPPLYYGYYNSTSTTNPRIYNSLSECQNSPSHNYNCTAVSKAGKDMWWRIVRINGDGTIRIIYDGTEYHQNGITTTDIYTAGQINFNPGKDHNAYVGFMYGSTDASATYEETHINIKKSNVMLQLEKWYETNMIKYEKYIDINAGFCGDRTAYLNYTTPGGGYSMQRTYYGSRVRSSNNNFTLQCSNNNDLYTINTSNQGNKSLTYPIGLITYDEARIAGLYENGGTATNYLSHVNNGVNIWTMSPYEFNPNPESSVYCITDAGDIRSCSTNESFGSSRISWGVALPVINLRADVNITGKGTPSNPYVVS